jgi:hypothetical protein
MICWRLPTGRDVVHHAPRIRLRDLDCSITLSLESHRSISSRSHQRVYCGWVCNHSSNLIVLDPFLCCIPHRQPAHPAETSMVEHFQFGSVLCFFQCPAFASLECYIDNNRLVEPATDIDRYILLLLSNWNCLFMEPNSFLAWLMRAVMSAVLLRNYYMYIRRETRRLTF